MIDYTLVVTSCGRFDLLEKTLESFYRHADCMPRSFILSDDSAEYLPSWCYNAADIIFNPLLRVGQIYSIDRAYQCVNTPYVFHCEDDWEFTSSGFIEESLEYLNADAKVINHWLRSPDDTNGHPHKDGRIATDYNRIWHGFTFNPTLKRMSDYVPYSSLTVFNPRKPWESEAAIGQYYKDKGYHATIGSKGYIKHIGEGRTVS